MTSIILTTVMLLAGIPAALAATGGPAHLGAGPRAIVDNPSDLIVPGGETYDLSGPHTYTNSIQINGTLKVKPYNGQSDGSGTVTLSASWVIIGPQGVIMADGRGFGGGGGGQNDYNNADNGGHGGSTGSGGDGADSSWGSGPQYWAGPGGGGSNGGQPGQGGPNGAAGTETGGGRGGDCPYGNKGGDGGDGFGGGGGGGGGSTAGGGGGGGGGTGGKDSVWTAGGDGAGSAKGAGGPGTGNSITNQQAGGNGGYMTAGTNGDTSNDLSVKMGSGGGGCGSSNNGGAGGGGGGGGAGGGSVTLSSSGDMVIHGLITTHGGGGGLCGNNVNVRGGGGAGGGVALAALTLTIDGTIDARGRDLNTLTTANGGTIKLAYSIKNIGSGTFLGGRLFADGKPHMNGLLGPFDGAEIAPVPVFSWSVATDPDNDPLTYHLQVAGDTEFSDPLIIDQDNLKKTTYTSPAPFLAGMKFYWRVSANDYAGPGNWSDVWSFSIDNTPPASSVQPLPKWSTSVNFPVAWTGTDNAAGVASYTIYVSDNNQQFAPWLVGTAATGGTYSGTDGHGYKFYSIAVDFAGNREPLHAREDAATTVDASPPVSILDDLPLYLNSTTISLSWRVADNTSGVATSTAYFSDNGADFSAFLVNSTQKAATYTVLENHMYQFYVRSRDVAGNYEAVPGQDRIQTVNVDLTPPATTVSLGSPVYGNRPVFTLPTNVLSFKAGDSYAGVGHTYYSIDGADAQTYNMPFRESDPGSHNMTYWSMDLALNMETPRTVWFYTDGTAPATTLSFDGPNFARSTTTYLASQTLIVLTASDRGSGLGKIIYHLDSGDPVVYTGPFKLNRNGSHVLYYNAIDNLGNAETEKNLRIQLDATPPVTTPTTPSGPQNVDVTISLHATDYDSGVAATYYTVLLGDTVVSDWQNGSSVDLPAAADHLRDGTYTIEFYSADNAGNNETVKSLEVTIDTQSLLTLSFKGGVTVTSDTFTVKGKAEPGSRVTVNKQPVTVLNDGSFSYDLGLNEGSNSVKVVATDPAGNVVTLSRTVTYNAPMSFSSPLLMVLIVVVIAVVLVAGLFMMFRGKGKTPAAYSEQRVGSPPGAAPPVPPAAPPTP